MRLEAIRGPLASLMVFIGAVVLVSTTVPAAAQKGKGGKHSPTPTPTPSASPSPTPREEASPEPSSSSSGTSEKSPDGAGAPTPGEDDPEMPPPLTPSAYPYGPYDNASLVALGNRLRAFGFSEQQVRQRAFAPFIIEGPARWENTWGALRQDPDETLRRHVGQDVFCNFGAPVLASERGRIQFGHDRLGGLIVRLHRQQGGYFYYAHLSGYNDEQFSSGDRVSVGDVIGFCGDSGNAEGTKPHVHFGYYSGGPQDPIGFLIDWRDRAEERARSTLGRLVGAVDRSMFARRFGDDLVPEPVAGPAADLHQEPVDILLDSIGLTPETSSVTEPSSIHPPALPSWGMLVGDDHLSLSSP